MCPVANPYRYAMMLGRYWSRSWLITLGVWSINLGFSPWQAAAISLFWHWYNLFITVWPRSLTGSHRLTATVPPFPDKSCKTTFIPHLSPQVPAQRCNDVCILQAYIYQHTAVLSANCTLTYIITIWGQVCRAERSFSALVPGIVWMTAVKPSISCVRCLYILQYY